MLNPADIKEFDLEKLVRLVESKRTFPEKVYVAALFYADMKWPVIPVQPEGKALPSRTYLQRRDIPQLSYRDASFDIDKVEEWFNPESGQFAKFNIGIACGNTVSAIDCDMKPDIDGITMWQETIGHEDMDFPRPIQETPGGGIHLIYLHKDGFRTKTNILPGVDSRGSGKAGGMASHIVAYPSTRVMPDKSRKQYKWRSGGKPLEPSQRVLDIIDSSIVVHTDGTEYHEHDKSKNRGNEEMSFDDYYTDPLPEDIQDALSKITDQSQDYDAWIKIGMSIHSYMDGTDGFDLWHEWSKFAGNYKSERDCWNHWNSFTVEGVGNINIGTLFWHARQRGYRKPGEESSHLASELRRDKNGKILNNNAHNLDLFLLSPEFRDKFGAFACYDEFTQKTTLGYSGDVVSDALCSNIAVWMSKGWHFERSSPNVGDRLLAIGRNSRYNSLQHYFEGLPVWDTTERIDHIARDILFASSDFQATAWRKWLINGVSQGMAERPYFGHMMIIIGKQGVGKSRFCKALSPNPEWVVDNMTLNLGRGYQAKEEEQKIMGKQIVEVAELAGFFTSGDQDLKSFLTQEGTTIRMPYARHAEYVQRRCSWIATGNEYEIIRDPTGSRRYVFIDIGDKIIDIKYVEENRDQMWAEAKHYYQLGEKMYLNQEEMNLQNAENARYRQKDAWEDVILGWATEKTHFKIDDVFEFCLKINDKNQWNHASRIRIKKVLESAKFSYEQKFIQNKNNRVYLSPDESTHPKPARLWLPNDTDEF